MGAWGSGIFENDDAMDWLAELVESEGIDLLVETLETIDTTSEVMEPDGTLGLAAAEIVATLKGKPGEELPEETADWMAANRPAVDARMVALALAAVRAIVKQSELRELWEEAESVSEWEEIVKGLEQRLANS